MCSSCFLEFQREGIKVVLADGQEIEADYVVSTLPTQAIGQLLLRHDPRLAAELSALSHSSIAVINLGYGSNVLKKKGFGYLVPFKEQEEILGLCVGLLDLSPAKSNSG